MKKLGGGHRKCSKCGKYIFGSVVHNCKLDEDKGMIKKCKQEPEEEVIEKCSEVIIWIQKIKKFGLYNYNSHNPLVTNKELLLNELNDLQIAIDNLKTKWCPEVIKKITEKDK